MEDEAVRKKKKRNKKITEVMGVMVEKVMVEKVMVMAEKRELVPNANQAGRIQEIEAKYIWLQ